MQYDAIMSKRNKSTESVIYYVVDYTHSTVVACSYCLDKLVQN